MLSFPSLSQSPYKVRVAAAQDLHQLADILTRSFYPPTSWRQWAFPFLRFSIYEDLKQRLNAATAHHACLAAVIIGPTTTSEWLVGTVEVAPRRYPLWVNRQPRQLYLSNLAVRENARRQGVARHLLAACEETAHTWGFRELYLHVMEDNVSARRLYRQAGYQIQYAETTLLSLLGARPRRLLLRKSLASEKSSPGLDNGCDSG